jgi:hypothetical protein
MLRQFWGALPTNQSYNKAQQGLSDADSLKLARLPLFSEDVDS